MVVKRPERLLYMFIWVYSSGNSRQDPVILADHCYTVSSFEASTHEQDSERDYALWFQRSVSKCGVASPSQSSLLNA